MLNERDYVTKFSTFVFREVALDFHTIYADGSAKVTTLCVPEKRLLLLTVLYAEPKGQQ